MRPPIDQIGTPPKWEQGIGWATFKAWRASEIPERDYYIQSAAHVASHLHYYRPVIYTPMSASNRDYVRCRIGGQRAYDQTSAKALGMWCDSIFNARSENEHNLSLFAWCIEKLEDGKLTDLIVKVQEVADKYRMIAVFPMQDIVEAEFVRAKDARERPHPKGDAR